MTTPREKFEFAASQREKQKQMEIPSELLKIQDSYNKSNIKRQHAFNLEIFEKQAELTREIQDKQSKLTKKLALFAFIGALVAAIIGALINSCIGGTNLLKNKTYQLQIETTPDKYQETASPSSPLPRKENPSTNVSPVQSQIPQQNKQNGVTTR